MKKFLLLSMSLALVAAPSCSRRPKAESDAAVRQAVERYLASRPNVNMQGMEMVLSGVKFQGDKAEADVAFRAKNQSGASMTMHYKLQRKGQGWEVEPRPAGSGHGGMMPPAGIGGSGDLPSGHPPVGSSPPSAIPPSQSKAGDLPAGHPPMKAK